MKTFLSLFLLAVSVVANAATPTSVVPTAAMEYSTNRNLGPNGYKYSLGTVIKQAHNTAVGIYSVGLQGGGSLAAPVSYDTGITLPSKAVIRNVFFDVVTAPNTNSGVIAFKAQSTGDLKADLATASWTSRVAGVPDGTTTNMIKLTAARTVYAVVSVTSSTGVLTVGKIKVFVDYVVSE